MFGTEREAGVGVDGESRMCPNGHPVVSDDDAFCGECGAPILTDPPAGGQSHSGRMVWPLVVGAVALVGVTAAVTAVVVGGSNSAAKKPHVQTAAAPATTTTTTATSQARPSSGPPPVAGFEPDGPPLKETVRVFARDTVSLADSYPSQQNHCDEAATSLVWRSLKGPVIAGDAFVDVTNGPPPTSVMQHRVTADHGTMTLDGCTFPVWTVLPGQTDMGEVAIEVQHFSPSATAATPTASTGGETRTSLTVADVQAALNTAVSRDFLAGGAVNVTCTDWPMPIAVGQTWVCAAPTVPETDVANVAIMITSLTPLTGQYVFLSGTDAGGGCGGHPQWALDALRRQGLYSYCPPPYGSTVGPKPFGG